MIFDDLSMRMVPKFLVLIFLEKKLGFGTFRVYVGHFQIQDGGQNFGSEDKYFIPVMYSKLDVKIYIFWVVKLKSVIQNPTQSVDTRIFQYGV